MSKYCSKGSHLGLSKYLLIGIDANIKDDLESVCYIMLDLYSNGKFLRDHSQLEYEGAKAALEPNSVCQKLPDVFLDFYYHVMGMNYTDEINYFHWKNLVLKTISKNLISKPYSWMSGGSTVQNNQEKD